MTINGEGNHPGGIMDERTDDHIAQVEAALAAVRRIPDPSEDSSSSGFSEAAVGAPISAILSAAREIVEYVLSASRRPQVSDANLQFAFPLGAMWADAVDLTADEVLSRSLITVQAFARTAETQELPGDAERVRSLRIIARELREAAAVRGGRSPGDVHGAPWYPHIREGDRWGDVLGYQAPSSASRAERVWPSMEHLREVLEQDVLEFPATAPDVPPTPLLPIPSTAVSEYEDLDLGSAWRVESDTRPKKSVDDTVDVWFGTSRSLRPGTSSEFGPELSRDLRLGCSYVFVPETHRRGSDGSSLWQKLLRLDFRDDTLKLQKTLVLDANFDAEFVKRMSAAPTKRVLLYIHGYNSPFESAIVCAAQLAVDLGYDGVAAAFSWSSRASHVEYIPDLAQSEAAWEQLVEFIGHLRRAGIDGLDVIVHSMGNRVLSWAVERLARSSTVIDRLYLAAADLDPEILRQRSAFYRSVCRSITSYASTEDRALGLSRLLHGVDRVGLLPPVTTMDGMTTIDVSDVEDSFLGHGYFAMSSPVLDDIRAALRDEAPGGVRRMTPVQDCSSPMHWRLHA